MLLLVLAASVAMVAAIALAGGPAAVFIVAIVSSLATSTAALISDHID